MAVTATTNVAPAGFSMGRVVNRFFGVLGRNLPLFLLLAALLVGLPGAVVSLVQASAWSKGLTGIDAVRVGLVLGGIDVNIAGNALLQGAVIYATATHLVGRRASFGESLAVSRRFFLPLLGISLIVAVGCGLGVILFVAPGILLALAWIVAAPAEVVERLGVVGSLSRSLELTRDHRAAIFALALVYLVAPWIVGVALDALIFPIAWSLGWFAPAHSRWGFIWEQAGVRLIADTLLASLSSAGIASTYFELRQVKDGVGVAQLAAVFD